MEIRTKELKKNALSILNENKIILLYSIVIMILAQPLFGVANVIFSLAGVVGTIQLTKFALDTTNKKEANIFDFSKLGKAIKTILWTCLYLLPYIVLYIVGIVILVAQMTFLAKDVVVGAFTVMGAYDLPAKTSSIPSVSPLWLFIGVVILIAAFVLLIIKSYSYSLATYMVFDEKYDGLTTKDMVLESKKIMDGRKMKLFILQLSFIGWAILIYIVLVLTVAIPFLAIIVAILGSGLLTPYILLTTIQFYKAITVSDEAVEVDDNE